MTSETERSPARSRADAVRVQILAAAAAMMRERGYAQMALRDLAREVGMKAGSLYYHFASKEELAVEVLREGVARAGRDVRARLDAMPEAAPRERLHAAMEQHLTTLLNTGDFASAHIRCYPFVPASVQKALEPVRHDYNLLWSGIIAECFDPAPDPALLRQTRHALVGAMNATLEWRDPARDEVALCVAILGRMVPERRSDRARD